MPLTATKLPDGMYLQAANPHSQYYYEFDGINKNWDYDDFNDAHPPILALFKCTEGQRFEDGEVQPGWQSFDGIYKKWVPSKMPNVDKASGYHVRQVYTLKSDKGGEKDIKITFGLQPEHITIIESTINELGFVNEYVFDMIGRKIGWLGYTVACYYIKHLRALNPPQR